MSSREQSKFLSLILRHDPGEIGLDLDGPARCEANAAIKASMLTQPSLDEIVRTSDKKRFEYDPTGTKIRACQGHSVEIDLALTEKTPPNFLFHGTSDRFLANIRLEGLLKMSRQHVHLSTDLDTARKVGRRHGGQLLLLSVTAGQMFRDDHKFYLSTNGVWLVDRVPVMYLERVTLTPL